MRINRLAVALLVVAVPLAGQSPIPDPDKVNDLATAISHAEGFGKRSTIPSRYHNPGDLKAFSRTTPMTGQVRLGKAGHIVFRDDEAGMAALRDYIVRMMDGRSTHYNPNLTLNQVARRYAENWRPWVKVVSKELGVPPNTTLRAYFNMTDAPVKAALRPAVKPVVVAAAAPCQPLSFRPLTPAKKTPAPPALSFSESPRVLQAMLDTPVHVPPLVEQDAQQHRRLPFFHRDDEQAVGTVRLVSSMTDSRTPRP